MKQFLISATLSLSLVASVLYASHKQFAVKYEQIFAEKRIVLTEYLTLAEKTLLQHKKGFIRYAD